MAGLGLAGTIRVLREATDQSRHQTQQGKCKNRHLSLGLGVGVGVVVVALH